MKCASCGYENDEESLTCNLCRGMLKARPQRVAPPGGSPIAASAPTIRVGLPVPRTSAASRSAAPPAQTPATAFKREDFRPRYLLNPVGPPPVELEAGVTFSFGRAPDNSLVIPSGRVSRNHAEIRWEGQRAILCDKGSSNGTSVNGKPVKEQELRSGDEIEIGPFFCTFVVERQLSLPEDGKKKALDATQTVAVSSGLLSGKIESNTIGEILQSIELNQKTGTLDAWGPDGQGWFQVREGLPLAAEFGPAKDDAAILKLMTLQAGRFTFTPQLTVSERRVKATITHLLLEANRLHDEAGSGNADEGTLDTQDGPVEP